MKNIVLLIMITQLNLSMAQAPRYKDAALSIDERLEDLISRMTIEEKAAQLVSFWSMDSTVFSADGEYAGVRDLEKVKYGIGAITYYLPNSPNQPQSWFAKCHNNVQKYAIEKSRLGIPVFIYGEALHGLIGYGATSFPQAIALGCTWDLQLIENISRAAAIEARSRGITQVLAPVLDLALDPRWGRFEECYGEDPYLVAELACASVHGFQGRSLPVSEDHVVATLKHFAGHGQPEAGKNLAPVTISERTFRASHLFPFEMAITKAGAQSVMAGYNEWDGVPNHTNARLLTKILREEWGFKGYVMSDLAGLDLVYKNHLAAADSAEAGRLALKAGLDLDLGSQGCFTALMTEVKKGTISESEITQAAKRVLRTKFLCGLFDNPYVDPNNVNKKLKIKEHQALALQAAHEAMVLLKNQNNILPLNAKTIKTLAVIGPNAASIHLGGYSTVPMQGVSVLEGIQNYSRGKFEVVYAEGCKITVNQECHAEVNEKPILSSPDADKLMINNAVNIAQKSDAIILVLGENELINREAWAENHLGDTDDLNLVGSQNDLAKEIISLGKPVVVLLFNGRPLTISYLQEHADAIIECWYLGQETGNAVADVIFGNANPGGKLSVTFPRSVGQLPCYYNKKPSVFRDYVLSDSSPLYPFGYGLSYTNFEYHNLKIHPAVISADETCEVSVEITNTGKMSGAEIVQLYIHDIVSMPTRPIKELKDFTRIKLNPGETETVRFILNAAKLSAFDLNMERTLETGNFEIMVGKNSADFLSDTLTIK